MLYFINLDATELENLNGERMVISFFFTPHDNTYVFFSDDSPTLHISGECPYLKDKIVFRTIYDYARYRDYLKHRNIHSLKSRWAYRLERSHTPQICRRCGQFTPTYPRTLIEKLQAFLYDTFEIGIAVEKHIHNMHS